MSIENGMVYVFATCERITDESAEHGDVAESGWVSSLDSQDIYESRNDVSPIFNCWMHELDNEETLDDLRFAIADKEWYEWERDGSRGYSKIPYVDLETGSNYFYCIHSFVKHYESDGYSETEFNIKHYL